MEIFCRNSNNICHIRYELYSIKYVSIIIMYAYAHTYIRVYSTRSLAEERLALFPGALEAAGDDPYEDPAQVLYIYHTHYIYCHTICVYTVIIICVCVYTIDAYRLLLGVAGRGRVLRAPRPVPGHTRR